MSRSGYTDGCDGWELIKWRGAVASALRGKRGQEFLRETLTVLDTMPVKELIDGELEIKGQVCVLGAVGKARGIELVKIDPYSAEQVSAQFGIAPAMAREIVYVNDDEWRHDTPAGRWAHVRAWVVSNLKETSK